ncbi:MAG TPA: serine hydrolase [Bacteroidales bacterium]|nr:serine hydrolase [Bacteroidales bacterium]
MKTFFVKTMKVGIFSFLLSCCLIGSAQNIPAFISDSLDSYIDKALKTWEIPGVAVCIVKDGKVVVSKGFGVCESGKKEKVDENTLFMIGSNTKAFTGTALAWMAAEMKCYLNDKVKTWVPEFITKDPWIAENATLTDIVCHRMGTATFQGDFTFFDSDLSSTEIIAKYGKLEPVNSFRTKWGYCNTGFLLAGTALSKISGMSWEQFIRTKIFEPLEMKRSLALISEINTVKNKAAAHTIADGKLTVIPYGHFDALAPAASICSSVEDMSHWLLALLDSGKYNNKSVIPYAAILETREPESIIGNARHTYNKSNYSLYGMGWELQDYESHGLVMHTGGVDGFVTSVTLVPDENLGIVVLTNTDQNYFYEALKWEILDAYLDLPYRNYSKIYNTYFKRRAARDMKEIQSWRDSVALKPALPLPVSAFKGIYENEVYGTITVSTDGNALKMEFEHHKDLSAKLEYIGNNRFLCTYSQPLFGIKVFPFVIDQGKVRSFTLSVADFLEYTTYSFTKKK